MSRHLSNGTGVGRRWPAILKLAALLIASVATVVWTWKLGRGRLGGPPMRAATSWSELERWASVRSPAELSMGVIRVLAMSVGAVLTVLVSVALATGFRASRFERAGRAPRTSASTRRILPSFLCHWRDAAFSLSLVTAVAAGALATPVAASAAGREPLPGVPRTTMAATRRAPAGNASVGQRWPDFDAREAARTPSTTTTSTPPTPPSTTPSVAPTTTTTTTIALVPSRAPTTTSSPAVAPLPAHPTPASVASAHTVRRGESFWSIAEAIVRAEGETLDEHRVAKYWRTLVDANRSTLGSARDPDLLFPGEIIVVPQLRA